MNKAKRFFINGLIISIPLFFFMFVISKGLEFINILIHPLVNLFKDDTIFGIGFKNLISLFILLLIFMLIGVLARTKAGKWILEKAGFYVPGFILLKEKLTGDKEFNESSMKSCLASIDDAWLFGFIIEEHLSGMRTVFVPSAPSPIGGNIYFMREDQIKKLDVPPSEISKYIMQFGYGSRKILDGKIKW